MGSQAQSVAGMLSYRCRRQGRWTFAVGGLGCLLALLVWLPGTARAQATINTGTSMNPVGSGARAMGQGNAFIAVADDATAASWNPAGLAQLEKPELSLAVEYLSSRGEISSLHHPESEDESTMDVADLNYLSVAYPFHPGRNLVLSLNYLKLYRFEREMAFPLRLRDLTPGMDVDLQYELEQSGSLAVLAPAIAVDVTDSLSLGLTLNLWNDDITRASSFNKTQTEKGVIEYYGANPFSSVTDDRFEVRRGYSVVLGAMYRLSKQWTLGAVVKPAFTLDLDHRRSVSYEDEYTPRERTEAESDAELEMPLVAGAGVAWRPSDPLTISFDATWTQWSEFSMNENGVDRNPLTDLPEDEGQCKDATTCRLGAEYLLVRPKFIVPLRCGLGYDPGPAIDQVDAFYTASVGTGLQVGRFAFDVGYEMRWGNGVNSSLYPPGWGSSEDVLQHRILASLIVYF
jgi:long-subunit fatty acid transport protein